jgi:hypothetical protein
MHRNVFNYIDCENAHALSVATALVPSGTLRERDRFLKTTTQVWQFGF